MGIVEVKMFGAECDNCGERWIDDHNGFVSFTDESSMKQVLEDDDTWWSGDEGIYCPSCFKFDDEGNIIIARTKSQTP